MNAQDRRPEPTERMRSAHGHAYGAKNRPDHSPALHGKRKGKPGSRPARPGLLPKKQTT
jgi:hypothetical protein